MILSWVGLEIMTLGMANHLNKSETTDHSSIIEMVYLVLARGFFLIDL